METLKNKQNFVPELINRQYEFEGNCKVAIVGDMHLHCSTPSSRIDNYSETCIQKLAILRRELISRDIHYVICAGDIFHIPKERTDFEYAVLEELLKFKKENISVFALTGNHDIPRERLDDINKTSLGIMYLTESLLPFTEITFKGEKDIIFHGVNFPNSIEPVTDFSKYNVCVCHKFYENSFDNDSLRKKDLQNLGYNMYVCGHDHVVYPLVKEVTTDGIVYIVRPGSFMRGTSHKYNTTRLVYMDVLDFSESVINRGKQVEIERVTLPVKEPKEVFSATVMEKNENISIKDITQELSNLVEQMYVHEAQNNSVYDVLDNSVIDAKIKSRIVEYLEQFGIYRKN